MMEIIWLLVFCFSWLIGFSLLIEIWLDEEEQQL
jgi:hypothetical protein